MNVLFRPCWDECVGGEAYDVILDTENYKFNDKVSLEFNFKDYVISIKNGILSIKKDCWNDYSIGGCIDLVDEGVAKKDDLHEIIPVLKEFGARFSELIKKEEEAKRKKEWLSSSSYEVEIKGWEW